MLFVFIATASGFFTMGLNGSHMKKIAGQTALAVSFALAGAGLASGTRHIANDYLAPATSAQEKAAARKYSKYLGAIAQRQTDLAETTDEEDAVQLETDKKSFRADALLDDDLSERDLRKIAETFNALGKDDGIVFRTAVYDPNAFANKSECKAVVDDGESKAASAERVETCMIVVREQEDRRDLLAAGLGGIFGIGFYGSFLLGRKSVPKRSSMP
jgi:hypothetical protein